MTTLQKLEYLKHKHPEISEIEAKYMIRFLNWVDKWKAVLEIMHKQYAADTGDNKSFMWFADGVYKEDRLLPKFFMLRLNCNN